jgi:DNA repair protein RadC
LFDSLKTTSTANPESQGPSDADLLAEIIGSGIKGRPAKVIAKDLLNKFGSFQELFDRNLGDFLTIKGLNTSKIIRIAAAMEISKRITRAL